MFLAPIFRFSFIFPTPDVVMCVCVFVCVADAHLIVLCCSTIGRYININADIVKALPLPTKCVKMVYTKISPYMESIAVASHAIGDRKQFVVLQLESLNIQTEFGKWARTCPLLVAAKIHTDLHIECVRQKATRYAEMCHDGIRSL